MWLGRLQGLAGPMSGWRCCQFAGPAGGAGWGLVAAGVGTDGARTAAAPLG